MNEFLVMSELVRVFGDRMVITARNFRFNVGDGANILIRRRAVGFEPLGRIHEGRIKYFPNSAALDDYLIGEDVPRRRIGAYDEYTFGSEHVEEIVSILLGGLDDFIESEDWVA